MELGRVEHRVALALWYFATTRELRVNALRPQEPSLAYERGLEGWVG